MQAGFDVTHLNDGAIQAMRMWLRHRGVPRVQVVARENDRFLCFEASSLDEVRHYSNFVKSIYQPMDLKLVFWDEERGEFLDEVGFRARLEGQRALEGADSRFGRDHLGAEHGREDYDVI